MSDAANEEITQALAQGDEVGFYRSNDDRSGAPAFTLRYRWSAFLVRSGAGQHVGTFASFDAAWNAGIEAAPPET